MSWRVTNAMPLLPLVFYSMPHDKQQSMSERASSNRQETQKEEKLCCRFFPHHLTIQVGCFESKDFPSLDLYFQRA